MVIVSQWPNGDATTENTRTKKNPNIRIQNYPEYTLEKIVKRTHNENWVKNSGFFIDLLFFFSRFLVVSGKIVARKAFSLRELEI